MKFYKFRIPQLIAICFIVVLSCSVNVYSDTRGKSLDTEQLQKILNIAGVESRRDTRGKSLDTEQLQKILNIAGVESEAIILNRNDGFNDGIFFTSKEGVVIVLGFSENGFQKDKPFLLSTLDGEVKVKLSNKGKLSIVGTDGVDDIIEDVLVLVECILNAVDQMVTEISECNFINVGAGVNCILDAVGNGVEEILNCL